MLSFVSVFVILPFLDFQSGSKGTFLPFITTLVLKLSAENMETNSVLSHVCVACIAVLSYVLYSSDFTTNTLIYSVVTKSRT